MAHAMRLERTSIHQIGPDWLITGYPQSSLSLAEGS